MSVSRAVLRFTLLSLAAMSKATSQSLPGPSSSSLERLRTMTAAFAEDSMRERRIGSAEHARIVTFLEAEIEKVAQRARADMRHVRQPVPIEIVTLDRAASNVTIGASISAAQGKLVLGADYVPVSGLFGLSTLDTTAVMSTFVHAGRLGVATSNGATASTSSFALLLPPLRPDGEPDYQLGASLDHLRAFGNSDAIFVATRDLMPQNVVDRLLQPRMVLRESSDARMRSPPVIAITRSLAGHLGRGQGGTRRSGHRGAIHIVYRRDTLLFRPQNLIAILPGSDPRLRSEYVVVVAHSDANGPLAAARSEIDSAKRMVMFAAIAPSALAALAEQFATAKVKPRRSLILLWAVGRDRGQLGVRHFLNALPVPRESIVGMLSIDGLGTLEHDRRGTVHSLLVSGSQKFEGLERVLSPLSLAWTPIDSTRLPDPQSIGGCNSALAQFARSGVAGVSMNARGASEYGSQMSRTAAPDIATVVAHVGIASELVQALANLDGRLDVDASAYAERCTE